MVPYPLDSSEASMKERFAAPPLLEIIAELRWEIQGYALQPDSPGLTMAMMPLMPAMLLPYEDAFVGFTKAMSVCGFNNSERLIPNGFPCMPHEPVMRYRHNGNDQGASETLKASTLFQIGAGIFTANAVPPYTSWEDFEPLVRTGVESLGVIVMPGGRPARFSPTLRYIDAFKLPLTDGMSLQDFMNRVMGFDLSVPETLRSVGSKQTQMPVVQVVKFLDFGRMNLQFADGNVNGERALLLDMSVVFDEKVDNDVRALMRAFGQAREEIHEVFVALTKPIHHLMKPIGSES